MKNKVGNSAELYIYGDIVDNTDFKWDEYDVMPQDVKNTLDQLSDVSELNIYINSGGGSVFSGNTIAQLLKRHKAYKTVYVDGIAASIASVIALAGDRVIIPSNAYFMIHNAWSGGVGSAADFRKMANTLDKIDEGILNTYSENLREGVDIATIKQFVEAETWMTGEEAAKYFNIEVTDAVKAVASASDFYGKYHKTPDKLVVKDNKEPKIIQFSDIEKQKYQNELDLLNL